MNNSNLRFTASQYTLLFPTLTRLILSFLLLMGSVSLFAQSENAGIVQSIALKSEATSTSNKAAFNPIGEVRHGHPLILANNIVIRVDQLKINLLDSVSVVRQPGTSSQYGYAAENGIINLKTRQRFETIEIENIRNANRLSGEKKFLLNGYFINNPSIKISKSAIKKVEVFDNANIHYVSIWTLTEDEKKPVSSLCNLFRNAQ